MHIKVKKFRNKNGTVAEYIQLVESYRSSEGKPKHRVVACLGRKGDPRGEERLANLTLKLADISGVNGLVDLNKELTHAWSKSIGPRFVFRKLWNDLELNRTLSSKYHEHAFMMVLNRLCDPQSKLSCMKWKETVYEPLWDEIKVHDLYKTLDWLMEKKDRIERDMFWSIRDLFNQDVDLILFDTTSVSYWGEGENAPLLLRRGHAKNKRNDLKQLIVGLLMTKEGIPVGHEVYPGNQIDVKSFPQMIAKAREKFLLGRVVWVTDRGTISESNINLLESLKQEYIIGVKMRMMNVGQKEVLLNRPLREFERLSKNLYVKQVEVNDRRYVVCHNPEQEKQDKINREYFRRIVENKVLHSTDKSWIIKNGFKKYIKLRENIIESIDYERLEKEKIYDGRWVLQTNTKLDYSEIARYYKSLCQVESAFKELKSTIDISPMYHWTEKRIRGHVFICFLALVLELGFRKRLGCASYSEVIRDLKKLEAVCSKVRDKEFIKRTEIFGKGDLAFRAVQLQIPGINLL